MRSGGQSTHATDWLGGTINLVLIITASWLYLLFIFLYLLSCHKLFLPCPPGNVLFGLWREGLIVRCAFTNWTDETDTEKFNASTTTARCAPYSPGARVDVQLSSWRSFFSVGFVAKGKLTRPSRSDEHLTRPVVHRPRMSASLHCTGDSSSIPVTACVLILL